MPPNPRPPGRNARPRGPTAASGGGALGLAGSALLHIGIVAATLFTVSHRLDIADESPPVVPVDLVSIAPITNIAPTVQQAPPAEELTPVPPPPTAQAEAPPAPPQEKPQPDKAEPAPDLKPKPTEKAPAETPKPAPKAQAAPEKKDKFDINNIMALLDKRTPAAPRGARIANQTVRGVGAQNAMTMQLIDALRNQIAQCWNPPVAAPDPSRLVVVMRVFLGPDGGVARTPVQTGGAGNDAYGRAAAESASRAIYGCAPYRLPAERYAEWRDIEITFDPRRMLAQ